MRVLVLIIISVLSFGCAHHSRAPKEIMPSVISPVFQTKNVQPFNQIRAKGRMNIRLHTGYAKSQVILHGDPRDLVGVLLKVQNHVLLLNLDKTYPKFGPVTVEIRTSRLNKVFYHGAGTIDAPKISSNDLELYINNQGRAVFAGNIHLQKLVAGGAGYLEIKDIKSANLQIFVSGKTKVQLRGIAYVSRIHLNQDSSLNLYWIKSDWLILRAKGRSFVQLAGIANKLDLELWGTARFNGRYLRAQRAFAKTHDRSVAEITAIKRQSTLALDVSDIYFYNIPQLRADFMAYNGAVLDMRDGAMFYLQDYTRYNK